MRASTFGPSRGRPSTDADHGWRSIAARQPPIRAVTSARQSAASGNSTSPKIVSRARSSTSSLVLTCQ
ncbi:hypothetical protein [Actinomadura sp. J1-007]|uniref:hypothetical protein n=1 Tax=Actinomadura sp. J1-007 TaxID=2661913 RepID=UPI002815D8C4|nr:hypothetical protein [Actinomadura sp. J1-007]